MIRVLATCAVLLATTTQSLPAEWRYPWAAAASALLNPRPGRTAGAYLGYGVGRTQQEAEQNAVNNCQRDVNANYYDDWGTCKLEGSFNQGCLYMTTGKNPRTGQARIHRGVNQSQVDDVCNSGGFVCHPSAELCAANH